MRAPKCRTPGSCGRPAPTGGADHLTARHALSDPHLGAEQVRVRRPDPAGVRDDDVQRGVHGAGERHLAVVRRSDHGAGRGREVDAAVSGCEPGDGLLERPDDGSTDGTRPGSCGLGLRRRRWARPWRHHGRHERRHNQGRRRVTDRDFAAGPATWTWRATTERAERRHRPPRARAHDTGRPGGRSENLSARRTRRKGPAKIFRSKRQRSQQTVRFDRHLRCHRDAPDATHCDGTSRER